MEVISWSPFYKLEMCYVSWSGGLAKQLATDGKSKSFEPKQSDSQDSLITIDSDLLTSLSVELLLLPLTLVTSSPSEPLQLQMTT